MRTLLVFAWLLAFASSGAADTYKRQPAVDVLHYQISLEFTDASDSIEATVTLHVHIREEETPDMWLDFEGMAIDGLRVKGIETPFQYGDGRIKFRFPGNTARHDIVDVEVRYHGVPARGLVIGRNSYGRRVLFTDNWPDHAHYWLPSIDHPSDKATVEMSVTAPDRYDVVANGFLAETVSLNDGRRRSRWTETSAIPTYSIAVGVAEFSIVHEEASGVRLAWYSFPQDAESAGQKFNRTALILTYFTELIGPYPYRKLAQVESVMRMTAMENANTIFYRESLFRTGQASHEPIPHEIAHQWFGNSVTPADWDHLWLSEGFATYFDALFQERLRGADALRSAMLEMEKRVKGFHLARTVPIIDETRTDLMKKLNPLNYEKGAWVLHMLRGLLGDSSFFEGIRRFYRYHQEGSVLSDDFKRVMESVSGRDLDGFFRQWLHRPGWPEYHMTWRWIEESEELVISVSQAQRAGLFDVFTVIEITQADGGEPVRLKVRLNEESHTFRIPAAHEPASVELDPDVWLLKSVYKAH